MLPEDGKFTPKLHSIKRPWRGESDALKTLWAKPAFGLVSRFMNIIPDPMNEGQSECAFLVLPSIDKYLEIIDGIHGLTGDTPLDQPYNASPTMEWSLGADMRQGFALADAGWGSLAKKVAQPSVDLANVLIDKSGDLSMHMDTTGSFVDVPSFLHGDPENMVEFDTFMPSERVIIYVDGFMSWCVPGERLVNRGIALLGAVLALESLGINVQVELTFAGNNSKIMSDKAGPKKCISQIRIHESGASVNAARLLAWIGHPGILRPVLYGGQASMWPGGSNNHFMAGFYAPGTLLPGVKGIIAVPGGGDSAWNELKTAEDWAKKAFGKVMASDGAAV